MLDYVRIDVTEVKDANKMMAHLSVLFVLTLLRSILILNERYAITVIIWHKNLYTLIDDFFYWKK